MLVKCGHLTLLSTCVWEHVRWVHGKSVKVWKRNRVNRYSPPPLPQLTEERGGGVMREEGGNEGEKERKRGRGRKREDILRGKAVIYEQATSNKQGEGDTPSPIKPGEVEGREERSWRQRFKQGGTVEKRKVGGKLMPDEPEWIDLNDSGMSRIQWHNKTPRSKKPDQVL